MGNKLNWNHVEKNPQGVDLLAQWEHNTEEDTFTLNRLWNNVRPAYLMTLTREEMKSLGSAITDYMAKNPPAKKPEPAKEEAKPMPEEKKEEKK